MLRLLSWFLWKWNTPKFGVVVEKKSQSQSFILNAPVNYVGEKKEAPDLSKSALKGEDGWRVKRAGEGGLLPPPVGCAFPTGPPSRDDRVACGGLVSSADLQGTGSAGLRVRALWLPGILTVLEWLLSAESHHGLRRKRCLNSKPGKSLLLFSDTLSRTWGHWECEILRRKEEWDASPQLRGWPPWAFGELEETKGFSSSFGLLPSALLLSVKIRCPKRKSVAFLNKIWKLLKHSFFQPMNINEVLFIWQVPWGKVLDGSYFFQRPSFKYFPRICSIIQNFISANYINYMLLWDLISKSLLNSSPE